MRRKSSSGQALVEYGLILVLVALASVVVLAVLGPSIGITFHNAADASSNPEVRAIQQRQTDIVLGTVFFEAVPTSAGTAAPPTAVPPTALPGATLANTAVPPVPTNTSIPPTPVPDWVFCANENGICSFSGTMEVRYGESGSYFYGVFTGSTPCTNAVFGDPISGTFKHCYYRPTSVAPTEVPTSTPVPTATLVNTDTPVPTAVEWTFCANENGICSFSGTKEVRYGENPSYFYRVFTGSTPCTNTVFGDPLVGVPKHCYYRDTTVVPTATPNANETAIAIANATATVAARQTGTAVAIANATGTVVAANATVVAANATATAVVVNATATAVAANATETAVAINATETAIAANPIISVTATRAYQSRRVYVDILLKTGMKVTVHDSQSDQDVAVNQNCKQSGDPTCTITFRLSDTETNAGTITVTVVSGGETYTMTATYPNYWGG